MKSGLLFLAALFVSTLTFTAHAEASDLTADACVSGGAPIQSAALLASDIPAWALQMNENQQLAMRFPMSCQDLKTAKDAVTLVSLALYPARAALRFSGVGAELGASMLALGLSSPAVLGVTVIGASGLAVVYIILKQTQDDCAKQDQNEFKKQLFQEIESKYGVRAQPSQQIKYQK